MSCKNATTSALALLGTALAIGLTPGLASAQSAQEEVDKQVAKLIADAISSRVAARELGVTEKNSIWGSYTRLGVDGFGSDTKTNVWIGGYDRDITDQWLAGFSASTSSTSGADSDSWSVNPYVAYRFNPNWFAIGSLSYSKSDFSGGDADAWGVGLSLNGLHRIDKFLLKGRAGIGFSRTESSVSGTNVVVGPPPTFTVTTTNTQFNTTDHSTSYVLDGEAGYFFMPDLYGYGGLQAGFSNESNSYALNARVGMEKRFGKGWSFGLKYEQRVDDDSPVNVDVWSVTASLRIAF